MVTLDFQDAEITEVIGVIAQATGKNFLYDDRVRGRVTVISPEPVTADEAYRVFESILQVKGFTTVPSPGGILKIVPLRDAKENPIDTVTGDKPLENRDLFITRLLPLRFVKAEQISETIKPLVSKEASVISYAPTNTLIITDSAANIRRLVNIIDQIDVSTYQEQIKLIPIRYADAAQLTAQLAEIFGGEAAARRHARRGPAAARAARARAAAAAAAAAGHPRRRDGDRRRRRAALHSRRAHELDRRDREQGRAARGRADHRAARLPAQGRGTHPRVPAAERRRRGDRADALEPGRAARGGGGARPATTRTNLSGVARRGRPGREARRSAASLGGGTVADLGDGVRITADAPTNSLIIQASAEAFATLSEVIEALDIRRPQVMVEALIMEVDVTDGQDLGAGWIYRTKRRQRRRARHRQRDRREPDDPIARQRRDRRPRAPRGQLHDRADRRLDRDRRPERQTSTISRPDHPGASSPRRESDDDTNIISAPTILTADNEEAEIVVGQNIPVPTSRLQATTHGRRSERTRSRPRRTSRARTSA